VFDNKLIEKMLESQTAEIDKCGFSCCVVYLARSIKEPLP